MKVNSVFIELSPKKKLGREIKKSNYSQPLCSLVWGPNTPQLSSFVYVVPPPHPKPF